MFCVIIFLFELLYLRIFCFGYDRKCRPNYYTILPNSLAYSIPLIKPKIINNTLCNGLNLIIITMDFVLETSIFIFEFKIWLCEATSQVGWVHQFKPDLPKNISDIDWVKRVILFKPELDLREVLVYTSFECTCHYLFLKSLSFSKKKLIYNFIVIMDFVIELMN